jgi:hypothetical protein
MQPLSCLVRLTECTTRIPFSPQRFELGNFVTRKQLSCRPVSIFLRVLTGY